MRQVSAPRHTAAASTMEDGRPSCGLTLPPTPGPHFKASNNSQYIRHYNANVIIGGKRNVHYEKDRTWVLEKK